MPDPLFIVATVIMTGLTGLVALVAVRTVWAFRQVATAVPRLEQPGRAASVTVLVPLGEDPVALDRCLRSLLNQAIDRLTIVALDYGGAGESGVVAEQLAGLDSRLRIADRASGTLPQVTTEWLLLTRPSTEHDPFAIGSALVHARRGRLDLLTLFGQPVYGTLAERLIDPAVYQLLGLGNPIPIVNDPTRPGVAVTLGEFTLVRTSVYRAVGGDRAEDLGRRAKRAGYRIQIADGRALFRFRRFAGSRQAQDGWFAILASVLGRRPGEAGLLAGLTLAVTVMPFVVPLIALAGSLVDPGSPTWTMVGLVGLSQLLLVLGSRRSINEIAGLAPWYALGQPIGGLVLAGILAQIARQARSPRIAPESVEPPVSTS